jgi:1,4-dihydroxy-2-naphthoate octaprenyltransferase
MKKIGFWIDNARTIALPQSILPALCAISLGALHDGFSWWMTIVALLGVICAHLGFNLADDYFDYKVGSADKREALNGEGFRARMHKYPYLTSGQATVGELRNAVIAFLAIAVACGAVILYFRGWPIALIMAIGGLLGISYSGGPLKLGYHGYGELVIGIMFGVLLMIGMQYAVCGVFDWNVLLLSVAVGMLVTNIVYTHSMLDIIADEKADKMTFARVLGSKKNQLGALALFSLLPFLVVFVGVAFGFFHWGYLVVSVLLPMALFLWKSVRKFVYDEEEDMTLKFWMGPMGDWENYKKAGLDWFLFRWLMARNLVTFFCLFLAIVNVVLSILK